MARVFLGHGRFGIVLCPSRVAPVKTGAFLINGSGALFLQILYKLALAKNSPYSTFLLRFEIVHRDIQKNLDVFLKEVFKRKKKFSRTRGFIKKYCDSNPPLS